MQTYIKSEEPESIPQGAKIQNGDTRNRQNLPPTQGVNSIDFKDAYFMVQEVHEISHQGRSHHCKALPLTVHSLHGVYHDTDGLTQGYKDPLVPR